MFRPLQGKRILVTGASSGIGRALAEQACRLGANVILVARTPQRLEEAAQSINSLGTGGRATTAAADVSVAEDRKRLLESAARELGGLDVLINNAGVASFGHFADSSEEIVRQVMETNFFAPAELIRLAVPILRKGNQPAIVNIGSMCGRRGLPAWPEYSASKFALCGLTEALRAELTRFGIHVLLATLGLTRTGLGSHLLRNTGRMKIEFSHGMDPADVARKILDALQRNRNEIVLGSEAKTLLALNRLVPRIIDRLMARKVRRLYADELEQSRLSS